MSSIFLFAHDQAKANRSNTQIQADLNERLKEFSEQIKKDGVSIPDVLRPLTQHTVAQCVFGPNHIAFRLEDGRVCRVSFSLRMDRAPCKTELKRKTGSSRATSPNTCRDGSSNRTGSGQYTVRSYRSPLSMLSRTSRGITFLREMQRQGICLARPVTSQISASEVPESLVEECQAVLEGKSRQLIIRELQHTNLDVNMAVNNLLSRDDETEQSDVGSGDGGTIGNGDDWDILSLFECPDSRMLLDSDSMIPDELIEPPTSPRPRGDPPPDYECGLLSDRRKRRRIYSRLAESYASRALGGLSDSSSGRSGLAEHVQSNASGTDGTDGNKQNPGSTRHCIQLGDQLEFWRDADEENNEIRFSTICALHSELVGLSCQGDLRQWRWADSTPFVSADTKNSSSKRATSVEAWEGISCETGSRGSVVYYHPRVPSLGLLDDRIVKLSGCATRATVLTASGKFATWADESLTTSLPVPSGSSTHSSNAHSGMLSFEHRATHFSDLRDEVVVELRTAPLITVVRCVSGAVFWWGVYPPYMRQRTIEKSRQHRTSVSSRSSNNGVVKSSGRQERAFKRAAQGVSSGVTPGTFVRMKSAPIFHAGAVGFTVVGGVPKVGTLLEDAWKITDVCRFRVSSALSPNPSGNASLSNAPTDGTLTTCGTTDDLSQHLLTCPHALSTAANSTTNTTGGQCVVQSSTTGSHTSASTSAAASPSVASGGDQMTSGGSNNLTFQEMPPPPSPASSTCSDQSVPVRVSPGTFKRKKVSSSSSDRGDYDSTSRATRGHSADREFQLASNLINTARLLSAAIDATNMSRALPNKTASDNSSVPLNTTQEEDWCLRDVIFVEDGRTQPVGIVLKVDGNIAAVKFLKDQERACLAANCIYSPVCNLVNSIVSGGGGPLPPLTGSAGLSTFSSNLGPLTVLDPMAWINDCRLLRKDDLTVVRYAGSSRVPEYVQRTPRRIPGFGLGRGVPADVDRGKIVTLTPENNRIHVVVEHGSPQSVTLAYQVYNLSGRIVLTHKLPSTFGTSTGRFDLEKATLTCPSEAPLLLRDSAGLVYPFVPWARSSGGSNTVHQEIGTNSITLLDLPPVQCAAFAWTPSRILSSASSVSGLTTSSVRAQTNKSSSDASQVLRCLLGLVIVRDLPLMQHVLRTNDAQIERLLSPDNELSMETTRNLAFEVVDGQRNLLHMAVTMCAPQSNCETSSEWTAKLDSVLSGPVQLVPLSSSATDAKELGVKAGGMASSNSAAISRPSNFWSSIARTTSQSTGLNMHELFIRSSIEAATVAAATSATCTQMRSDDRDSRPAVANGTNFWHLPPVRKDELTRRVASYRIIRLLLESQQLRPHLIQLLTARNTENLTPFMLAVKCRAYAVAEFIYETIQCLSMLPPSALGMLEKDLPGSVKSVKGTRDMNREFFFPVDSRPDDSPLFLLCYNDTCSFTWTGPDHIRQDIFECRTCGLMDSLCCCTECARVCHRGHDCRLKRTSPTAYCDCWEKCRCQSLIAGAQTPRRELFHQLLRDTELIQMVNSRNEHLLLFLVKCVERQLREQKQYRPSRRRIGSITNRSAGGPLSGTGTSTVLSSQGSNWDCSRDLNQNSTGSGAEEPDHDLEPPRFAHKALELALDCPVAVHSILSLDSNTRSTDISGVSKSAACLDEENLLLAQAGATQIDDFVFTLVCKCPTELVDTLIATINRHLAINVPDLPNESVGRDRLESSLTASSSGFLCRPVKPTAEQMRIAAGRFIRSVARIYTTMTLELTADHKKKKNRLLLTQLAPLDVCRRIFSCLAPVALVELPHLAAGLLTPVRTGTLRPSVPFSLMTQAADAVQGLEQFFAVERSNHSRHRFMQLVEQNRVSESSNTSESHGLFVRATDENQMNRSDAQESSRRTHQMPSDPQTQPASSSVSHSNRPTVVSSLHVDLSASNHPTVHTSGSLSEDTTTYNANTSFVPTTLNDPSVLTMQMQSTIRDIDHDHDSSIPQNRTCSVVPLSGATSTSRAHCDDMFDVPSTIAGTDESHCTLSSLSRPLRRPYAVLISDSAASIDLNEGASGSSGPESTTDGCEQPDTSVSVRVRRPQLTEVYSCSDSYAKRRRTLTPATGSPTRQVDDTSAFSITQEGNTSTPEEEESKGSYALLDADDPASQASSTGATVATIGGSTVDFDQGSDNTNGSVETVFNSRTERTASSEFTVNSLSLRPEQVESVPDLPTPVELVGTGRSDDFNYGELLNSVVNVYHSAMVEPSTTDANDSQTDNCLDSARPVRIDYSNVDDASDSQVSDFGEDDEQDDGEDDDGEANGDDEEDDDETEDEDADEDGYNEDDGDELIEGEDDEDDDDENDDDSSHHSDASSIDAGSRSTSPTWTAWSRNSVFSRLSSRVQSSNTGLDDNNPAPISSSTDGLSVSGRRTTTTEAPGVSSSSTTTSNTSTMSTGAQQSTRSGSSSGRRTVPSMISLLPPSSVSNNAPTLIVSTSGVSGSNVLSTSDSTLTPGSASENGCIIHTQVQLSRAFGCLLRVIADLIVELHEEVNNAGAMRRCASVPSAMATGPSVYEQQRQMHPFNSGGCSNLNSAHPPISSSGNGSVHPFTLLLSSPMSSTNLTSSSATVNARCFGPSLSDYQRSHLTQSGTNPVAHSLSFCSTLPRLMPTSRTVVGARSVLLTQVELAEVVAAIGVVLGPIWQWLAHGLDNLEAQLRYSAAWNAHFPGRPTSTVGDNSPWTTTNVVDGGINANASTCRDWTNASSASSRQAISRSATGRLNNANNTVSNATHRSDGETHGTIQSAVLGQRHDFLSYVFSLMRATSGDHGDGVPFIGAPMHKHLAYVLDALLYFFKAFECAWPSGVIPQLTELNCPLNVGGSARLGIASSQLPGRPENNCIERDPTSKDLTDTFSCSDSTPQVLIGRMAQREDAFFRRSESVLSLSGLGLDLIETPLMESLPLALQPHRLHPNASRTDLFGSARFFPEVLEVTSTKDQALCNWPLHMNSRSSAWGDRTADGGSKVGTSNNNYSSNTDEDNPPTHLTHLKRHQLLTGGGFLDSIGHSATLLSRWCLSLEFFGRHFSGDVGAEHRSYILELGGFTVKEARFRKHMERLRNSERRDLPLEVDRDRTSLILGTVRQLNAEYAKRQSQTTNHLTTSSGLNTPSAGIGRYSVNYNSSNHHPASNTSSLRSASSGNSPIAVAFLLGTTTDSPLLGTLFGASPAPTSLTSSGPLNQNQPAILSCHRVKVTFKDEPGEGSGVARSFFTAFSEAVLSQEVLPPLNGLLTPVSTPSATATTANSQSHLNTPFHHRHYTSPSRRYGSTSAATNRVLLSSTTVASTTAINTSAVSITAANVTGVSRAGSPTTVTFSYTTRPMDSSISVPIPIYPQHNSSSRFPGRARTSAWRRAGGLSAHAPPFYPTSTAIPLHSPPPPPPPPRLRSTSRSPVSMDITSLPPSPTHATEEFASADPNMTSLSPGASPGSQPHGRLDAIPRPLLLRTSLNSASATASSTPPTASPSSSRPTSPAQSDLEHPGTTSTDVNTLDQQTVGNRLFSQLYVLTRSSRLASRITGMLLELPAAEHVVLLENDDALLNRVEEARAVLTMAEAGERDRPGNSEQPPSSTHSQQQQQQPILERLVKWRCTPSACTSSSAKTSSSANSASASVSSAAEIIDGFTDTEPERVPLFWQPGIQGYYFPRAVPGINVTPPVPVDPVKLAFRYSLYRGVGRVIGLCLLTNETCPLHLSRPVLQYILGRVLHWHDFAFYDPTTFEGLRQLLQHTLPNQENLEGSVADYNLTFSLIPAVEEGGLANEPGRPASINCSHHLAPQGEDVEVNDSNVYEFVKRYTEFKMIEAVRESLEQMRLGVFDILPRNALDRLTAEDLRLLLNGAGDIDVEVLASYTTFHNETGTSGTDLTKSIENSGATNGVDKVARLKRWFWNTVRSMDNKQRQDLLYFWTSSPALPASSQGFQPMPSITIRPADDHHLPSANTCISRLYLPLYSSKQILREKLLQAIEVKSFGFV